MKVLVTSGGTKVPIDMVRDITNMSKGTFGTKIATEFLLMGHDVIFFKAKYSKSPFDFNISLDHSSKETTFRMLEEKYEFVQKYHRRYCEFVYSTFDEYKEILERIVKLERPDIVVLAAAASDYGVENPHKGKVRSNDLLKIELKQLPKLIYFIKHWNPDCKLVGFKLLVNSKESELISAAKRSIEDNECDMIVANDLAEIKDNNHRVHLIFPKNTPITYNTDPNNPNFLARKVAEHTVSL